MTQDKRQVEIENVVDIIKPFGTDAGRCVCSEAIAQSLVDAGFGSSERFEIVGTLVSPFGAVGVKDYCGIKPIDYKKEEG